MAPRHAPLDVHEERQRKQLEEELRIEILPGTELMADFGSHHFVKDAGSRGPVLVPQPSDDPHDPLNWNWKRKYLVIGIANIFSFMLGFGPLALPPQFGVYIEDFHSDLPGVIQFVGSDAYEADLDRCLYPHSRIFKLHLGAHFHQLWSSRSLDMELGGLLHQHDLARNSNFLRQFHGRLCTERNWCGSSRDHATRYVI
jgi:hypothetical protein